MEPKQKQYPVVDVTGDRSKIRCCKEQYCIGTWNVRSMNQGKLEVVKQEMARVNVNVDILGISELKWTGMGEFNSDDHYIYYRRQESLGKNELWTEICDTVQETGIKIIPKKKKCKRAKWLSEEALQIAEKRGEERQRRKEKIYPFECRFPKNSKER